MARSDVIADTLDGNGHRPRHVVGFEALVLRAPDPAHRLERWIADLTGPLEGPLEDLSGGAWRARRYAREADWPPVHAGQERRKFLARGRDGAWLAKFAGLGREGEETLARARALLTAAQAATETVEILIRDRAMARQAHASRREQADLDETAGRPQLEDLS